MAKTSEIFVTISVGRQIGKTLYRRSLMTRKQLLMEAVQKAYEPNNIVLALKLVDGSTETITNNKVKSKAEYIEKAYDDDLCLKSCKEIKIINWMVI